MVAKGIWKWAALCMVLVFIASAILLSSLGGPEALAKTPEAMRSEIAWVRYGIYVLIVVGWPIVVLILTRADSNRITEDEAKRLAARRHAFHRYLLKIVLFIAAYEVLLVQHLWIT